MPATLSQNVPESHVATSPPDGVNMLHVARHRSNEMTAAASEKIGHRGLSVTSREQTFATTDPVIAPWHRPPLTVSPEKQEVLLPAPLTTLA